MSNEYSWRENALSDQICVYFGRQKSMLASHSILHVRTMALAHTVSDYHAWANLMWRPVSWSGFGTRLLGSYKSFKWYLNGYLGRSQDTLRWVKFKLQQTGCVTCSNCPLSGGKSHRLTRVIQVR